MTTDLALVSAMCGIPSVGDEVKSFACAFGGLLWPAGALGLNSIPSICL